MANKPLKFYDVKLRKSITTSAYTHKKMRVKGVMREFAIAHTPDGRQLWRITK